MRMSLSLLWKTFDTGVKYSACAGTDVLRTCQKWKGEKLIWMSGVRFTRQAEKRKEIEGALQGSDIQRQVGEAVIW